MCKSFCLVSLILKHTRYYHHYHLVSGFSFFALSQCKDFQGKFWTCFRLIEFLSISSPVVQPDHSPSSDSFAVFFTPNIQQQQQ